MFDVSFGEMILLAAIALIAIGPKQLPQVARTLGRLLREFQRATSDFTRTIVDARDATQQSLMDTQRTMVDSLTVDIDAKAKGPKMPTPEPGAPAWSSERSQTVAVASAVAQAPDAAQGPVAQTTPAAQEVQPSVAGPIIRPAAEARPIGAVAQAPVPVAVPDASPANVSTPLTSEKKEV